MAFDINIHIKDHAKLIIDNLIVEKNETEFVHFTCSIDTALLIEQGFDTQEKIDTLFENMLHNIIDKKLTVKEKSYKYTNRHNVTSQKYRNRMIKFDTLLSAYHNQHFDVSKSVNPHLHFLGNKKVRLGKNFMYLKQVLKDEAEQYGLKFHFSDKSRETGLTKPQERSIKTMSWIFNQGNKQKIKTYLNEEDKLGKVLDLLSTHYMHSQNISYFIKVMSIINQRLYEMDIDYLYNDLNLKEHIFFSITSEQEEMIESLKNDEDIMLDMSKVFDREVIKYAYGFGSQAMEVFVDKFNIKKMDKQKIHIKPRTNIVDNKEKGNHFKTLVMEDIKQAISQAEDEKSLKNILMDMGYIKVSMKTAKIKNTKRQKVGLNLITPKNMKMSIGFVDLGMNWSEIMYVMMSNKSKKKKLETKESKIKNYTRKKSNVLVDDFTLYMYKVRRLLVIYELEQKDENNIIYHLADKFEVYRSNMYNITTFSSRDTTISDYGDKIVLKKSGSLIDDVSEMLNLAVLKGWDLNSLIVEGDISFVIESRKQINKLKSIGLRRSKHKNNAPNVL